jgi:phosphatidylglycerophosphate synthase
MTTERRPLTTRELSIFQRLAAGLIAMRVRPNAISLMSIAFAAAAAWCLVVTSRVDGAQARWFFALGAVFVQLRLLANMLDGMVAIGSGDTSPLGDLFNEVPDRLTDALILIGAGYALGGSVVLGYGATILAVFTAYLRAFGGTHGVKRLFLGPMAKPHRMAAVTAGCLWTALAPATWRSFCGRSRSAAS